MGRLSLIAVNQDLQEAKKLLTDHDIILVRGEGHEPSLRDDVRTIKKFMDRISFWMTAIGLAFVSQAIGTLWYLVTHPYLLQQTVSVVSK